MPQIFRVAGYLVYFWSNEGNPSEPIHVHITKGEPSANCTKVWLTQSGHALLCNNNSKIPERALRNIIDIIEARSQEIISKWYNYFGTVHFYC